MLEAEGLRLEANSVFEAGGFASWEVSGLRFEDVVLLGVLIIIALSDYPSFGAPQRIYKTIEFSINLLTAASYFLSV